MRIAFRSLSSAKPSTFRTFTRQSHLRIARRISRRTNLAARALWGSQGDERISQSYSARKQALLEFIGTISPSPDISAFDVPAPVLAAMRQTVSNLLGTLPPQFFRITISTRSENLAQLMFSVLMTGYMFGSAWTRMQLTQSLGSLADTVALVGSSSTSSSSTPSSLSMSGSIDDIYLESGGGLQGGVYGSGPGGATGMAAGAQKLRVEGEVLRWHHEDGVQQVTALDYIEQLEAEVTGLRRLLETQRLQQAAAASNSTTNTSSRSTGLPPGSVGNELLDYLKGLSGDQVAEFTDCASPDVLNAMNALVHRMNGDGETDEGEWGKGRTECTAPELAQLLYWLMAVGHRLRTLEVRLSLHAALEAGPSPRGKDDGADGPAASSDWVPRLPPGR